MAMPHVTITELLEYFDAVRGRTNAYPDNVRGDDLEREYEHPRFGVITGSWMVGHIIVEKSQHTGQVALVRGIIRGFGK
jgi:hypothetical protein